MFAQLSIAQREYDLDREQYLQTFKPLRDQAVEISDISRAAYNEGGLDLVRLLDAERVRVEAEVSWVQALENYHQSVVSLEYARGYIRESQSNLFRIHCPMHRIADRLSGQPPNQATANDSKPADPGEVVISPAEQSAQKIEVQAVQMRDLPAVLSLPGHIALPDNATWRVAC